MTPFATPMQTPAKAPPPPIPALPGEPGAATAAQQAARDAQIAAQDAQRAAQEAAQAAQKAGEPVLAPDVVAPPPPPPPGRLQTSTQLPFNPVELAERAIPIVGMGLAGLIVIFVGWPLARAFARRADKRMELGAVRAQDLQPQIRQLQESLDAMAVELERISEAQRFQAKLLAERSSASDPAKRG